MYVSFHVFGIIMSSHSIEFHLRVYIGYGSSSLSCYDREGLRMTGTGGISEGH